MELSSNILELTKPCTKCGVKKPITAFSKRSGGKYLKSHCKQCCSIQWNRNWIKKSSEYSSARKAKKLSDPIKAKANKKRWYEGSKIRGKVTPENLICSKCGVKKSYKLFYKLSSSPTGRNPRCKICTQTYQSAFYRKSELYRKNRIEQSTRQNRKRKYGVTPEFFDAILLAQNNKCAICDVILDGSRFSLKGQLDHCHKTKKIRGILCSPCNISIGALKENVAVLFRAIQYLEKFKE